MGFESNRSSAHVVGKSLSHKRLVVRGEPFCFSFRSPVVAARPAHNGTQRGYSHAMAQQNSPEDPLAGLIDAILDSYASDDRTHHINSTFLPNREQTIEIIELLRRLLFPGFYEEQRLTWKRVRYHVGELLARTQDLLYEQVRQALRHDLNRRKGEGVGDECDTCDVDADRITNAFLESIPQLRRLLSTDVQAAFDGDPAAKHTDETIFCYPGLDAIFIHRIAHRLYELNVPMLPRIMSEYAHNETGIDIHPGATIGESFFIDHGTGVVIGETTEIGNRVKVYQGVTLGAKSTKAVAANRNKKRHPTIEDDVTIYGGAIILGGETVIGEGATVGGTVFLTHSVPANHLVVMKDAEIRMIDRSKKGTAEAEALALDWSI